jgi:hypothetical protein
VPSLVPALVLVALEMEPQVVVGGAATAALVVARAVMVAEGAKVVVPTVEVVTGPCLEDTAEEKAQERR